MTIGSTSTSVSLKSNLSSLGTSVLSWRRSRSYSTRIGSFHFHDPTTIGLLSDPSVYASANRPLTEAEKHEFDKVSKALAFALCGKLSESLIVNRAARWYVDFLERRCKEGWKNIIGPVLEPGEAATAEGATVRNLCIAFRIFRTIVLELRNGEDIALSDLVMAVYNEEKMDFVEENKWLTEVMVFTAFGWLSTSQIVRNRFCFPNL